MKIRGIAHRGYPAKYAENTLTSFQAARDLGYSQLELDVHISKDGVPVVMHDAAIHRMTNGKGLIKDYTVEQLKQFRIGETETIPTLEEALRLVKGHMIVNIDLKQTGDYYKGMEEAVYEVLRATGMVDQVYLMSLDHFSLIKMRKLSPDVELGVSFIGSMPCVFPFMKEIRARYLAVKLCYMTDEYYRMIEEHGYELIAWPVNSEADMSLVVEKYPNALVTTNDLEKWMSFLEKRKQAEHSRIS
ncbi:glycerophosphodiester phosphodiesterase [Paenibacillus allorhizosphaerae]|uniref:Glycerophosphodiester phosphodiesterase n=1 Tax=Paenibacillus allorhizosphaerae TaxID=2849866 RepID=A0ABM8VQ03_9BACL|nr:glycerophosphodiester phosphodiesterase family protein [Paenibacillus allorhizosphaerae]CAG7653594.1 Glycerophosphodiester phosphodiesterase [Paenibacillus allorhizosphaerae]